MHLFFFLDSMIISWFFRISCLSTLHRESSNEKRPTRCIRPIKVATHWCRPFSGLPLYYSIFQKQGSVFIVMISFIWVPQFPFLALFYQIFNVFKLIIPWKSNSWIQWSYALLMASLMVFPASEAASTGQAFFLRPRQRKERKAK